MSLAVAVEAVAVVVLVAAVLVEGAEVQDNLKTVQRVLEEDKPDQPGAGMSTARPDEQDH